MSAVQAARRLTEWAPAHPVITVYLDLDPEEFAAPPARVTQINSLLDEAARTIEADDSLDHDDLGALREDVERLRRYLLSDEPPFQGARALAVFSSSRGELFEVVQVSRPLPPRVVIDRTPYVEPLVAAARLGRWCVVLISRAEAVVLAGSPERLRELGRIDDDVHGQHTQGGWSQARYQRSVDQDAMNHMRDVADQVHRLWQRAPFDRLALGGPTESVARFEELLHNDLRPLLVPERVSADLSAAGEDEIRDAVLALVDDVQRVRERSALDRLAEALGRGGRGAGGLADTLAALNERRVEVLLLAADWDARGARCPACGLLTEQETGACPADGTGLEAVDHLREAMVEAALAQDAEVLSIAEFPDLGPHRGVGALLRF